MLPPPDAPWLPPRRPGLDRGARSAAFAGLHVGARAVGQPWMMLRPGVGAVLALSRADGASEEVARTPVFSLAACAQVAQTSCANLAGECTSGSGAET